MKKRVVQHYPVPPVASERDKVVETFAMRGRVLRKRGRAGEIIGKGGGGHFELRLGSLFKKGKV